MAFQPGVGVVTSMWSTLLDASNDVYGPIAARRIRDLDTVIHWLEPDQTPYYTFLTSIPGRTTRNPKFEWFEGDSLEQSAAVDDATPPTWSATTVGATLVGGPLQVTDASIFQKYSIVMFTNTGIVAQVIADPNVSAKTIDVKTLTAPANLNDISDTEVIEIIGSAFPEGSGRGEMAAKSLVNKYNFTGIYKQEVGITGTAAASAWYGGDEWKLRVMEATIAHKKQIEMSFLFGEWMPGVGTLTPEGYDSTTKTPIRSTRGMKNWISTNTGTPAWSTFQLRSGTNMFLTLAQQMFRYGSKTKFAFCSDTFLTKIHTKEFLQDTPQVSLEPPRETKLGFVVSGFRTPHGILNFVNHPRFTGKLAYWLMVIDPANVKRRPMNTRDTKFKMLPWTGRDAIEGEIITETGLQAIQEKTHAFYDFDEAT